MKIYVDVRALGRIQLWLDGSESLTIFMGAEGEGDGDGWLDFDLNLLKLFDPIEIFERPGRLR